jgi:hypothetical protein
MANLRKIILQCILLCAFLSAPFAIADHKLSHLAEPSVVEQCQLCLHSPTLTNFIETDVLDVSQIIYQTLHFSLISYDSSKPAKYVGLSRAPPKN